MTQADEYRRKAEEAREAAAKLPSGSERDALERLERHWVSLADAVRIRDRRPDPWLREVHGTQ